MTKGSINEIWSYLIIEELIRQQVSYFCIAPGSRSTPLTVAIAKHPQAKTCIHFDERGLSYHALGYAKASKKPVAIVVTSGTAVINTFPAIVEANMENIPLILLSADRPPELRDTGANQSIDQVKCFGNFVQWQFDLPCPDKNIKQQFVLTTIDHAVFKSVQHSAPVQLNCMFREPFFDDNTISIDSTLNSWQQSKKPFTQYKKMIPDVQHVPDIAQIANYKKGLIILGAMPKNEDLTPILALAEQLNWPILPDILSGARTGYNPATLIPYHDLILKNMTLPTPEIILQLGPRFISKSLLQYTEQANTAHFILVDETPKKQDPAHQVNERIVMTPVNFCKAMLQYHPKEINRDWISLWKEASTHVETHLDTIFTNDTELTEPSVIRHIIHHLPKSQELFLGASMPIRDANLYANPKGNTCTIYANRGASGIDGNIATALGISQSIQKPITIIIGDLTLLHDLNSLDLIRHMDYPCKIIVINNQGGGIFSFLPIHNQHDVFEKFFATPHQHSFEAISKQFGLSYCHPKDYSDLSCALAQERSLFIEIHSNREANYQFHQAINQQLQQAVYV